MRINWNWEEYPMQLINWKVKPEYVQEKKAEVEFMLARNQKISVSLTRDLAELIKMGIDVQVNAKLTITQHNSEEILEQNKNGMFGYKNQKGEDAIDYDEVFNNRKGIEKEYSVTVDQVTGKICFCNENEGSEVIIQGIIAGYIKKEKDRSEPPGAHFDNTIEQDGSNIKKALFSGSVYLENIPVDLLGQTVDTNQEEIPFKEEKEVKKEVKDEKELAKPKKEAILKLPTESALRKLPKGQLKPPRGSSRTQREVWWTKLREKYNTCFDTGGNWIGWPPDSLDSSDTENVMVADKSTDKVHPKLDDVESDDRVPGLLKRVGADNKMTTLADKKIRGGLILGALVQGKGYATLWTPTAVGEEQYSALIVVNKPRTGKFMLAGLARNSSFAEKVKGYDLHDVMVLGKKYFTEETKVFYVCNAVSANQELGTQEKDIVDIKENSA